jgi:Trp operon repressor
VLTHDDAAVLQVVLRSRNLDVPYLARALGRSHAQVQRSLDRLTADRILQTDPTGSVLDPPQESIVDVAVNTLNNQAHTALTLSRALSELPNLIRDWEWGLSDDDSKIPVEVFTGQSAIVDAWWRYMDRTHPVSTVGVIPDANGFLLVSEADAARLVEYIGPNGGGIRLIIHPGTLNDASRPAVDALLAMGMEFRVMDNPPSWFFADGDKVAALPAQWGDQWPQRVLLARNPVLADMLRAYFELLWEAAADLEQAHSPFHMILELLAQGMTDEEIATRLCVSSRTIRRKVAEAMQAYGVTNRFTLGRAWTRATGT